MFSAESLVDLQSLSALPNPVMSSCRNVSSPSAVKGTRKPNVNLNSLLPPTKNAYLSEKEDDYDYLQLDSKPEVGDRRRGGAGGKKGRRNAGQALLQRKLCRQAYLIKDVLVGPAEGDAKEGHTHLGKKRRSRLLSDHINDFNLSVPYSLNRKNRWNALDDTAGCLVGSNTNQLALLESKDEPVKYSIVESYFRWNTSDGLPTNRPDQGIKAYHEFNMNGQLLTSRQANSARGSTLQNLLSQAQASSGLNEPQQAVRSNPLTNQDLNVQYRLSKAHPVGKLMGIDFSKPNNKGRGRCVKRVTTQLSTSVYATNELDEKEEQEEEEEEEDQPPANNENEEDLLGMYRPKKHTFTLADFLIDHAEQPVIVRRNQSLDSFASQEDDSVIEEEYNFVLSNGIQLAKESRMVRSSLSSEVVVMMPTESQQPASLQLNQLRANKAWLFECINLALDHYGVESVEQWEAQCQLLSQLPNVRFRRLTKWRFLVDLSYELLGENRQPARPLLIMVVDHQLAKLLINAAFKCSLKECRLEAFIRRKTFVDPTRALLNLIELVAGVCRPFFLKCTEEEQKAKCLGLEPFKTIYNSQSLSSEVEPMDVYGILELNRAQLAGFTSPTGGDHQFVLLSPQLSASEEEEQGNSIKQQQQHPHHPEEDTLSLSDFETIDMDEFEEEEDKTTTLVQQEMRVKPVVEAQAFVATCEQCGEKQISKAKTGVMVNMLEGCGHRYCSMCLAQALLIQLEGGKVPLKCLSAVCECEVHLDVLQLVMPLPLANYASSLHFLSTQIADGKKSVSQCPACQQLIPITKTPPEYGQIACSRCCVHWCISCHKEPHWPLTCAQAKHWSKKFKQQYEMDCQRAKSLEDEDVEKKQKAQKPNAIAQQFSAICSEARAHRLDTRTGWQLAKHMRRLTNYKQERQFVDLRKTALHLLEYGYAWLYMTRGEEKSSGCRIQIKALLSALRNKLEALHSELLFSSSLTDTNTLLGRLQGVQALVSKVLDKFLIQAP